MNSDIIIFKEPRNFNHYWNKVEKKLIFPPPPFDYEAAVERISRAQDERNGKGVKE